MFRAEVASGSERGQIIKPHKCRKLYLLILLLRQFYKLSKNAPTDVIIIDGYPRSLEQMSELDKYLVDENEVKLVNVIEVEVSEEVARDRVLVVQEEVMIMWKYLIIE